MLLRVLLTNSPMVFGVCFMLPSGNIARILHPNQVDYSRTGTITLAVRKIAPPLPDREQDGFRVRGSQTQRFRYAEHFDNQLFLVDFAACLRLSKSSVPIKVVRGCGSNRRASNSLVSRLDLFWRFSKEQAIHSIWFPSRSGPAIGFPSGRCRACLARLLT